MKGRRLAKTVTIVCLVDRRRNPLSRVMRHAGFMVVDSFSTDQVVAMCVNNDIDAVVLDQDFFVETEGWSVAQSLKLIKPKLCVLLVSRAQRLHDSLPKGVDAIVSQQPQEAIDALRDMLGLEGKRSKAR